MSRVGHLAVLVVLALCASYASVAAAKKVNMGDLRLVRRLRASYKRGVVIAPMSRNVTVGLGQSAELECEAFGQPGPTIHWMYNGVRILESVNERIIDSEAIFEEAGNDDGDILPYGETKSILRIECAQPEDMGLYSCVADIPTKRVIRRTKLIVSEESQDEPEVECANQPKRSGNPETRVTPHPASLNMWSTARIGSPGMRIQLFCRSSGDPQPSAVWTWKDQMITSDSDDYELLPNGDLVIQSLDLSLQGIYKCTVSNGVGPVIESDTFVLAFGSKAVYKMFAGASQMSFPGKKPRRS